MTQLLTAAFKALGMAPSRRELGLVCDAIRASGDKASLGLWATPTPGVSLPGSTGWWRSRRRRAPASMWRSMCGRRSGARGRSRGTWRRRSLDTGLLRDLAGDSRRGVPDARFAWNAAVSAQVARPLLSGESASESSVGRHLSRSSWTSTALGTGCWGPRPASAPEDLNRALPTHTDSYRVGWDTCRVA